MAAPLDISLDKPEQLNEAELRPVSKRSPWGVPGTTADVFKAVWLTADLALVAVTGILSSWLRFGYVDVSGPKALAIVMAVVIAVIAFRYVKLHDMEIAPKPLAQLQRATMAMTIVLVVVATLGYATKTGEDISRLWAAIWYVWAILAFTSTRGLVARVYGNLEEAGSFTRRFVVFSTADDIPRLARFLRRWSSLMGNSDAILGIFLDRPEDCPPDFHWAHMIVGSIDDFTAWKGREITDAAVAVVPAGDRREVEPFLERLQTIAVDVDLVAGDVDETWAHSRVTKVAGLPSVRVMTRPLSARQHLLKRAEDLLVAGFALVLSAPLLLLIALAVKLDSRGPVFFRQQRHGFNNTAFRVFKFRTMHFNDEVLASVEQAKKNDPRVTRVGGILRRTSLDELPQIFNVLSGEMSIVGPRPHAVEHNDHYANRIRSYLARHRIKPGITGWAQVNGLRGETDTDEKMQRRVEYDLFYTDHWSLKLDFKIILMTFRALIHQNAY